MFATGKPYFTLRPEAVVEVYVGDTVELACGANGLPPPRVQWQSRNDPKKTFSGEFERSGVCILPLNVEEDPLDVGWFW